MTLSLSKAISQCPRSLFGDKEKGIRPKYRKIFATVAKALLADAGEKFSEKTVDLVADVINVSSMQRAVADHRKFLEDGGVKPPKKERGKPSKKAKTDEDDLGLGTSKKGKKTKAAKAGKKPKAKAAPAPAKKTPGKASSKPAKAPKSEKTGGTKVDAVAAARAALAAKKAAKEKTGGKPAEETVEI
jgi:hypothetical protein